MFLKRMMNVSNVLRKIDIRALPDLEMGGTGGRVTFLPERFKQCPNALKSGCKRLKLRGKQNRSQFPHLMKLL